MLRNNFHKICNKCKRKFCIRIRKILKKLFFVCLISGVLTIKNVKCQDNQAVEDFQSSQQDDLLSYVDDFINLPQGGTPWKVFGETGMDEYPIMDNEGNEWTGVRPRFTDKVKKLESKEILVQGFMFPLEQDEKQSLFLLGPFPLTCPYHPHTSSNLLIEVHTESPIIFSYDAVNIKGKLELVPIDDEYNIFFRLKDAKLVIN